MRIQTKIQKWGNSLALRLAGPMKTIPHFTENMLVEVNISENGLHIQPVTKHKQGKLPFSEKQLLSGLNEKTAHADKIAIPTRKELGE